MNDIYPYYVILIFLLELISSQNKEIILLLKHLMIY